MPRYIAFLRGINVGGHRVKMDRLKALFEELGLRDVSTFIASGNVLFSADSDDGEGLRSEIERHLARELGYEVATFLRSPAQLAAIAEFGRGDDGATSPPTSLYVTFLHRPASASLRADLEALESQTDTFHFAKTEIYWRIQGKLSDSPLFGRRLDRVTGATQMTMRNMNTLRRIVAKSSPADAT